MNTVELSPDDISRINFMLQAREIYQKASKIAWQPLREKLDAIEKEYGLNAAVDAACKLEFEHSLKTLYLNIKFKEQDKISLERKNE